MERATRPFDERGQVESSLREAYLKLADGPVPDPLLDVLMRHCSHEPHRPELQTQRRDRAGLVRRFLQGRRRSQR